MKGIGKVCQLGNRAISKWVNTAENKMVVSLSHCEIETLVERTAWRVLGPR